MERTDEEGLAWFLKGRLAQHEVVVREERPKSGRVLWVRRRDQLSCMGNEKEAFS